MGFVVIKTRLSEKSTNALDFSWSRVIKKLQRGKADILYKCEDTSADKVIKTDVQHLSRFYTYVILPIENLSTKDNIQKKVKEKLTASNGTYVIVSDSGFQVITPLETMA